MLRVFSALSAIFGKLKLLRRIKLTPLGHVVLTLTHRTEKTDNNALFLFRHTDSIPQTPEVTQAAYWQRLYQLPFGQRAAGQDRSNGCDHLD
ncbi:MAG: hypothetical protein UX37_C0031G0001 [Microgenomates group bacterium GW2011_GWA2_46_16]|nr:MAG: hypothetical protein UX37_C0031G0001 [Microgenomates group bacterium GW2011_GWA2_46_16]